MLQQEDRYIDPVSANRQAPLRLSVFEEKFGNIIVLRRNKKELEELEVCSLAPAFGRVGPWYIQRTDS